MVDGAMKNNFYRVIITFHVLDVEPIILMSAKLNLTSTIKWLYAIVENVKINTIVCFVHNKSMTLM